MSENNEKDAKFDYTKFDTKQFGDRSYKGGDYQIDPELCKNGGTHKTRKCTDLLCAIVFVVTMLCMLTVTIYSYINGQPAKYMAPIDGDGNICGFSNDTIGYSKLYLANIKGASDSPSKAFSFGVCVKSCPSENTKNATCAPSFQTECNKYVTYGSWELLSYCIPIYDELSPSQQVNFDELQKGFASSNVGGFMMELYLARWITLICIGVSTLLSIGYIKLMDKFAFTMAWISVVFVEIGLILTGIVAYMAKNDALVDSYMYGGGDVSQSEVAGYKAVYWCSWIAAGFYLLFAICSFHSLRISIKIVEVASDFYSDTKRAVLIPLMYFTIAIVIFVCWMFALACVCSLGEITTESVLLQSKDVERSSLNQGMIALMVIGMIWIVEFLAACNQFVIICAAADWYFDPIDEKHSDMWIGMLWACGKNMGTIALGSFIMTLVDIIRGTFEYLGNKIEQASGNNACTKCCISCMRWCLACFDRCLRFINMNAYIYCAIAGTPFCESAVNAFLLMLKNAAKFGFVNSIGGMFMFLAKACISILTTVIGWGLMKLMLPTQSHIYICLFIIFCASFCVAGTFISVFDAASQTILQCFILDQEISARSGSDVLTHGSEELHKFMQGHINKGNSVNATREEQVNQPLNPNEME